MRESARGALATPLGGSPMLRMASVPLPCPDGSTAAHCHFRDEVTRIFGGYTAVPMCGGWRDPQTGICYHEPGILYWIAMQPGAVADLDLDAIAVKAAEAMQQQSVLIQHASGDVVILDCNELAERDVS